MQQGIEQTPGSMLEIYMKALNNSTNDAFLDTINMGVGSYTDAEYWQQIEAFRNGLYADSAMTEKIMKRAVRQTQRAIVDAVYDEDDDSKLLRQIDPPEPRDDQTKQEYLDEHMEDIWNNLGWAGEDGEEGYSKNQHQAWLVNTVTELELDWVPPHWRMLKARHEASRSKGARLLDNLFGRPPEPDVQPMEDFS